MPLYSKLNAVVKLSKRVAEENSNKEESNVKFDLNVHFRNSIYLVLLDVMYGFRLLIYCELKQCFHNILCTQLTWMVDQANRMFEPNDRLLL